MEELFQYLDSIHPLSNELRDHLLKTIKFKKIPKRHLLLKAGHINKHIYFIRKGLLRAFYLKGNRSEVCSWFMKEGDIIVSIESFYEQQESYEYIQALEETELFYITHDELKHIYIQFPEFNFAGRELTIKYFILWAKQLRMIRMNNAQERLSWLIKNYSELLLRVSAKNIASYLGITEVTFSNNRKEINRPPDGI